MKSSLLMQRMICLTRCTRQNLAMSARTVGCCRHSRHLAMSVLIGASTPCSRSLALGRMRNCSHMVNGMCRCWTALSRGCWPPAPYRAGRAGSPALSAPSRAEDDTRRHLDEQQEGPMTISYNCSIHVPCSSPHTDSAKCGSWARWMGSACRPARARSACACPAERRAGCRRRWRARTRRARSADTLRTGRAASG